MLRKGVGVIIVLACLAVTQISWPQGEGVLFENPHHQYVQQYEGTKTCLQCHEEAAQDAFSSIHYQWNADALNILNSAGKQLGKMITSNDFCTNPSINWIGILKNSKDQVIGNGCSKCHAGLGLKPSAEMSQAQLENIDCLICHAYNYKREVYKTEDEKLKWRPVKWDQPDTMLNIAQNVKSPEKEMCLRCHAGAGGGFNYKRGDIEPAHAWAERDFDVHMGSGMSCVQCHKFEDHKLLGAGTQLAGVDRAGDLRCQNCHTGELHSDETLNKHLASIACTSCHIPTFAKEYATDVHRDWSKSEYLEKKDKYEPVITFEKNVKPVYTWWNGKDGTISLLNEAVEETDGKVVIYDPHGSIDDPESKIHAFKLHTGKLPIDKATGEFIPIKVGVMFKTGKADAAVKMGAKQYLGKEDVEIGWVDTVRYMGIFHEVAPKEQALQCMDCHGEGGRMDWEALGYENNPMASGGRKL